MTVCMSSLMVRSKPLEGWWTGIMKKPKFIRSSYGLGVMREADQVRRCLALASTCLSLEYEVSEEAGDWQWADVMGLGGWQRDSEQHVSCA